MMITETTLHKMKILILNGKFPSLDLIALLSNAISRKCNMIYRRSVSVITQPPTPIQSISTAIVTHPTQESSTDSDRGSRPPKRRRPHDEEEMKLFRRVRIKTEIRVHDRGPKSSIFVSNLGPDVNEYILVSLFHARFPSCMSAKIMTDPFSGISRGYGFVWFADDSDRWKALTEMGGVYCGNRPMRISTTQIDDEERQLADEDDPEAEEELKSRLEAKAEEDQLQRQFGNKKPYNDPETLNQIEEVTPQTLHPYIEDPDAEAVVYETALDEAERPGFESENERWLRLEAEAELDDELQKEAAVEEELNNRSLEEELTFYDSEEDSDDPGNKYGAKARNKREEELSRMMMIEDDGEEDEAMDISDDDIGITMDPFPPLYVLSYTLA